MTLGSRIKALRISKKMTQKDLSDKVGVSVVSIRHWEMGTKHPSVFAAISLSKALEVSLNSLLNVEEQGLKELTTLTTDEIRLLSDYRLLDAHSKMIVRTLCSLESERFDSKPDSTDSAKTPLKFVPRYFTPSAAGYSVPIDGEDYELIPVTDEAFSEADFAVKIQGNSMSPYISDGDTVFVKRCCELEQGDIGIFCVDGAMYCKQYYVDEEKNLHLISSNPAMAKSNVFVSADSGSEVKCYGRVLLR